MQDFDQRQEREQKMEQIEAKVEIKDKEIKEQAIIIKSLKAELAQLQKQIADMKALHSAASPIKSMEQRLDLLNQDLIQ